MVGDPMIDPNVNPTINVTVTQTADATLTLTWSGAPAGTTSYQITPTFSDGAYTPSGSCTAGSPVSGCKYTNLAADNTASFVVTGYDNNAHQTATATTDPVAIGPNAPTGVTVANTGVATTSLRVTWIATSTGAGGGVITYTALANPGGLHCPATAPAVTCDITGLTPGVAYSVVVTATLTDGALTPPAGTSIFSAPSLSAVVLKPGGPSSVTAVSGPGHGQVTVSWTPGAFSAATTSYYTATADHAVGGGSPELCNTLAASAVTSCVVNSLLPGTPYTFTVIAHHDNTTANDSASSSASNPAFAYGSEISLQADDNGMYVTAENAGNNPLIATRAAVGAWEVFDVTSNSDGTISLKAEANSEYVTAASSTSALIANASSIGTAQKFTLALGAHGGYNLQAASNSMWVSADVAGAAALIANRVLPGPWEKFYIAGQNPAPS
jgi:hypothetical protein